MIWKTELIKKTISSDGSEKWDATQSIQDLISVQMNLKSLRSFLNQYPLYSTTRQTLVQLEWILGVENEQESLANMHELIRQSIETISFVSLLIDYKLPSMIGSLSDLEKRELQGFTFEALVSTVKGRDVGKMLMASLVNKQIEKEIGVELITATLQSRCPSICQTNEVVTIDSSDMSNPTSQSYYKRIECYNLIFSMFESIDTLLTITTTRRRAHPLRIQKQSNHRFFLELLLLRITFHTSLYDWFIQHGLHNELLRIQSPYLEDYLVNKGFLKQPEFIFSIAQSPGLTLLTRIEYLTKAVTNAKSSAGLEFGGNQELLNHHRRTRYHGIQARTVAESAWASIMLKTKEDAIANNRSHIEALSDKIKSLAENSTDENVFPLGTFHDLFETKLPPWSSNKALVFLIQEIHALLDKWLEHVRTLLHHRMNDETQLVDALHKIQSKLRRAA
ncbi:hypothetical protein BSLG_008929 [Batrachochytrium salamandrivorans]|nr:hypothetical protein BSLG_008929 [Batrachochytrium salamandrivorans]